MSMSKREAERRLFEAAANLTDPAERSAFLAQACGDDATLRQRLELLLEGHFQAEGFLTHPPRREAPPPDSAPPETPATLGGRYRPIEKLGEGGFGEVWLAEQTEPVQRRVAVKILKPGMDTRQVVRRFEAERQTLALMDHPNIARVLDAGATDTGRPYFVMDLVRGTRITRYCDEHRLSIRERLDLFIQVCQAIQHAHQKGIIHRDIKPSNILVVLHEGPAAAGVPTIIDFGIAKATQPELTDRTLTLEFQQFLGTPTYVSPEQAEGRTLDIDTRSDLYSLGVLLYELLTGRTPFDARELTQGGLDALRQMIREREPLRPSARLEALADEDLNTTAQCRATDASRLVRLLEGDLDWIVMKCLEKDRMRRYATVHALVHDLERYARSEPVTARPPSARYRLGKFVRRNQVLVGAAGAVGLALLLGTGISAWQARMATRARTLAERQLYAARLNLAQQEFEQNNIARVRQLLDETAAFPDRGFEWYYWQRQTHLDLKTLRAHCGWIHSVAFSPDGQRIVGGGGDLLTAPGGPESTAKVWDLASGAVVLTLEGHRGSVIATDFSPDGQRIVTGSWDATAKVWDSGSGKELLTLQGHEAGVWAVCFSPDGRRIATGSWDQTAKVWDAESGKGLYTLDAHRGPILAVAWSPDGQRVVTGSADRTAKVWDAGSGKERVTLEGHADLARAVAFSPDGQRILTTCEDRTGRVWDANGGREVLRLIGHDAGVLAGAFSPDGRWIVTAGRDSTARVWDAASGRELFTLKGHTEQIRAVAISPDGRQIVTGSRDRTVKVWEARDRFTFRGHRAAVLSVAFSPDGQRIVTGSLDRTAKVFEVASGKELLTLRGHQGGVTALGFSADGQHIVTGGWDGVIRVWESASGKECSTLPEQHSGIRSLAVSRDGRRIMAAAWDQSVRVWEAASGKGLLELEGHRGGTGAVAFSPDDRWIVTGGEDGTARIWNATSGELVLVLRRHEGAVKAVAFSPDGRRIVTGSEDRTAKVWDAAGGREVLTLKGHVAAIKSVAFSPDGSRIVTGSADADATGKVWETVSGRQLLTLKGHVDAVNAVAFSADGQRIVTAGVDKTARVWEAATADQVTGWQREEETAATGLALGQGAPASAAGADPTMRAPDRAALTHWLVLASIPYEGSSGAAAIVQEQLPHEAELRPRAGERVTVGETELVWTEVRTASDVIDFWQLLSAGQHASVGYAVCYLQAEASQTGLVLKVSHRDLARVYLNGHIVYRHEAVRSQGPSPEVATGLTLNVGLNVLVLKVLVEIGPDMHGAVWVTDAAGQPVPGLRVTVDPDAER